MNFIKIGLGLIVITLGLASPILSIATPPPRVNKNLIIKNAKELFNASHSVVAGNPNGTVTLVEFFDYLCSYCQTETPVINRLIQENKNLRVVYKQYPLHGGVAIYAAAAAIAANEQGKFILFHEALMGYDKDLTQPVILKLAKSVGLDVNKLTSTMKSSQVANSLSKDIKLGNAIKISGTPTIIVVRIDPQNPATLDKTKIYSGYAESFETIQNWISSF